MLFCCVSSEVFWFEVVLPLFEFCWKVLQFFYFVFGTFKKHVGIFFLVYFGFASCFLFFSPFFGGVDNGFIYDVCWFLSGGFFV